jgi:DNA-binding transcriptional regulator YhcF (GntR family)
MNKSELANFAAVSRETASRIISQFESEGILEDWNGLLSIKDIRKLLFIKDQLN